MNGQELAMYDTLHQIALFAQVSDEQLTWIISHSDEIVVPAGDLLFAEGSEANYFYVLLAGALQIRKRFGRQEIVLNTHLPGDFTGEVPLLTGTPHIANASALQESRLLRIEAATFRTLLLSCSVLAGTLLPVIASRVQATEMMVSQHEKLAALDKFAAGLAHELNNPASAGRRAASQMRAAMTQLDRLTLSFGEHLNTAQLSSLIPSRPATASSSPRNLLGQSDKEEEFVDWLEAHGFDDGWQLAPMLVYAGVDTASLEMLTLALDRPTLQQALTWTATMQAIRRSLDTMEQITQRISELVHAVKEYSYMDQASQKEIDIHEGLESTLTILSYKLKRITVIREYDRQIPHITAYGGELNQVWTNLIDNAIDALDECGTLRVRTMQEGEYVLVEIADTGTGIPPDIQARIFEPFFTTKDVGAGTGLGLDIAYRIIVGRHHGDVCVSSKPGDTRFQIRLPIVASY